jgi:hypothetical protein
LSSKKLESNPILSLDSRAMAKLAKKRKKGAELGPNSKHP